MRVQLATRQVVGLGAGGPIDWLSEMGLAVGRVLNPQRRSNRAASAHRRQPQVALLAGPPVGLGAADLTDPTLQAAALALYTALQTRGCINGYDQLTKNFQVAYEGAGGVLPKDSGGRNPEDGLYGANSAAALQEIYPDALAGCVGAAPAGGGGGGLSTASSTGLSPTMTTAGFPTSLNAYFADLMSGGPSLWWTVIPLGLFGIAMWADKHDKKHGRRRTARKPKARARRARRRGGRRTKRGRKASRKGRRRNPATIFRVRRTRHSGSTYSVRFVDGGHGAYGANRRDKTADLKPVETRRDGIYDVHVKARSAGGSTNTFIDGPFRATSVLDVVQQWIARNT